MDIKFKQFINEKRVSLMENANEFSKLKFQYLESDDIKETINYYLKTKGVDPKVINNILLDSCLGYDEFSDNDHEDLITTGYILGYIQAKIGNKIYGVTFDGKRYFYIGYEKEILNVIRTELNKVSYK